MTIKNINKHLLTLSGMTDFLSRNSDADETGLSDIMMKDLIAIRNDLIEYKRKLQMKNDKKKKKFFHH